MKLNSSITTNSPIEKMITHGSDTLSNEELLSIIVGLGNQYEYGNQIATNIVNAIGHSRNLLDLSYHELIKTKGITDSRACSLIASFELAKRVYSIKPKHTTFDKAETVYEHMQPLLIGEKVENFYALYLDCRCQLIEKRLFPWLIKLFITIFEKS